MTILFRKCGLGLYLVCFCTWVRADEPISTWLTRPILGPTQTVVEVRSFIERRLPSIPKVNSASEWSRTAERLRRKTLEEVVFRGDAVRWRDAKTKLEWLDTIEGGPGYRIRKLRYEALPGLWIPALLYEPLNLSGKAPVVLNLNGHEAAGKAVLNKQLRCINLAKRGMLALSPDWLGIGQLNGPNFRHSYMNQLDLCGASGLAPFYLVMQRGLDVLLSLDNADRERVAVAGLSGGGWQTIFLSALDPRVTLANPVAGFSGFQTRIRFEKDLGDSEQHPCDMATVLDYTHLTAMRAPRPTLLTYNAKDECCFASGHALEPLVNAARPMFELFGKPENLRTHVNQEPGTHNFDRENREAFYRMLGDHFFPGDKQFNSIETPFDAEIKTADQLHVELPSNNADFHTLAVELSKKLPVNSRIPSGNVAFGEWQHFKREQLRDLVRATNYTVNAKRIGGEESSELKAALWQFKLGEWTLPVVELSRGESKGTTILISDEGRNNVAAEAERQLAAGQRVLAVDLFYFGESKLGRIDVRYALLVGAVGERPLGIQASQLGALATWAKDRAKETLKVIAVGPRNSLIALVAAGLPAGGIDTIELRDSLGSLKEIIEKNWNVDQKPEMFCFGLLKEFDIPQLEALAAPTRIAKRQL